MTANAKEIAAPQSGKGGPRIIESEGYRENPSRAVNVFGVINEELVRKLTPEIQRLRADPGQRPITVYIDSPGGGIQSYVHLSGLLFHPDQDGRTCRIITVATSYAASAAARLLVRGDYSMAYRDATIHCHGSRVEGLELMITRETAESLSESLSQFNDEMSSDFANKSLENFVWLTVFFDRVIRETIDRESFKYETHLVPVLAQEIRANLSPRNRQLMESVLAEIQAVSELESYLHRPSRRRMLDKAEARGTGYRDLRLIKFITDYISTRADEDQLRNGISRWTSGEILRLYSLRRDYFHRFVSDCDDPNRLLMMICSPDDLREAESLKDQAKQTSFLLGKAGGMLFMIWQLATTLSVNLMKGENQLAATDAYWLGLMKKS